MIFNTAMMMILHRGSQVIVGTLIYLSSEMCAICAQIFPFYFRNVRRSSLINVDSLQLIKRKFVTNRFFFLHLSNPRTHGISKMKRKCFDAHVKIYMALKIVHISKCIPNDMEKKTLLFWRNNGHDVYFIFLSIFFSL